ncbi:MAG: hypothetical protein IKF68_05000, partial [Erysipelotrichaceae bacterium]|nr:hypothetical protein [Erysipelotrichaceae bacterium]
MKCPNCSGTLYYDIHDQILKCRRCSSSFSVDDHEQDSIFKKIPFGGRVYTCKRCGVQIISGDD